MSCLHVCPSCACHVRSNETTCPFCDVTLPDDFGTCGTPRATGRPMTRAAFILMSATALTACGKSPGMGGGADIYGPPPVDVGPDASAKTQNQPPPPPDAGPVSTPEKK